MFDRKARHPRQEMHSDSQLPKPKRYPDRKKYPVKNDYLEMLEAYAKEHQKFNALVDSIRNNINAQNRVWTAMENEHMVLHTEASEETNDIEKMNISFETIDINSFDDRYRCVVMTCG
jgi:hypothetical protein